MQNSVYFKESEFAHCQPACKLSDMSQALLDALDYARSLYGRPIVLSSAYRSKEYELSKGRTGTSSHCKGLAVDILCDNSADRVRLVIALLRAGFRRLGIAQNYLHVDLDESKPKALWLYDFLRAYEKKP